MKFENMQYIFLCCGGVLTVFRGLTLNTYTWLEGSELILRLFQFSYIYIMMTFMTFLTFLAFMTFLTSMTLMILIIEKWLKSLKSVGSYLSRLIIHDKYVSSC
jgi:hypothetical protein